MTIKPSSSYLLNQFLYRIPHSFFMSMLLMIVFSLPLTGIYVVYIYATNGEPTEFYKSPQYWVTLSIIFMLLVYARNIINDLLYQKNSTVDNNDKKISVNLGGYNKENTTYPLAKISTIEATQNIIEGLFGICTLTISGEFDEGVTLSGFNYSQAKRFAAETLKAKS